MKFFDRLLTIVITATLTSVFWIVFGSALFDLASDNSDDEEVAIETPVVAPAGVSAPEPVTPAAPAVTPAAPPVMTPSPTPTVSVPVVQPVPAEPVAPQAAPVPPAPQVAPEPE